MARDKCWLSKTVYNKNLNNFSIDINDNITETIIFEMSQLFPNCEFTDKENASIQFKRTNSEKLGDEGFEIVKQNEGVIIRAVTTKGLLYGLFMFYQIMIETGQIPEIFQSIPDQSIRMINHWDNFDGSIERGYAGKSIFYDNNKFRKNLDIVREYARLLSSIGINALSINNVNVHEKENFFITEPYLNDIKEIADVFRKYGLKIYLSINFAAPIGVGGLITADPLDEEVSKFWERTTEKIYSIIPDFGGFVVKADSEGEPGPFSYGRNHDDGANMLARALNPYGGTLIWRCFVYNCLQDWRDRSIDRAKAAFDTFINLDGKFDNNVILQIKNGPIDFQVREPVSPLFGALKATNQILEFQITQEYTGQQKHICYLLPMWKEVLDFNTKYSETNSTVKDILHNQSPSPKKSGLAAIVNIGMDDNWTGHKLAQLNLFAYGRICWNNELSSADISYEWIKLTFDLTTELQEILTDILLTSRETYENYTAPLGVGFMVRPNHHYGPDIDGYEYDRWGTYHFSDRNGMGVNRTLKNGTGYTQQYSNQKFEEFENLETCPDNLVLFFHHLPYDHVLHSGKTLIQHIYDTHFDGCRKVEEYIEKWSLFKGKIDQRSYQNVAERLLEQLSSARDWRDQVNTYFYRKSGIDDIYQRKIYP